MASPWRGDYLGWATLESLYAEIHSLRESDRRNRAEINKLKLQMEKMSAKLEKMKHCRQRRIRAGDAPPTDFADLPTREDDAVLRCGSAAESTLHHLVEKHLLSPCKKERLALRVLAAKQFIDAETHDERHEQMDAFCEELRPICAQLNIGQAKTNDVLAAFRKAALHRVEPGQHECPAVRCRGSSSHRGHTTYM